MTNPTLLLKNFEILGRKYCDRYLDWDREKLELDWFEALKFLFAHSFMRGRKDTLSNEFYWFAIDRLQHGLLESEEKDAAYRRLQERADEFEKEFLLSFKKKYGLGKTTASKHERFVEEIAKNNEVIRLLTTPKIVTVHWGRETYKKKIKLGNDEDVLMVLDTLKLVSADRRKNLYTYLRAIIQNHSVQTAYAELTQIRSVKDKIASFVIRDIGLLNLGLIEDSFEFAFPVDTWVKRLALMIGCTTTSDDGVKKYFIEQCIEALVDPLLVAAGVWYSGFHSLDIVLNYLGKHPVDGEA